MSSDERFVAGPDRVDVGLSYDEYLRRPAVAQAPVRRCLPLPLARGPGVPAGPVQRRHLTAEERAEIDARVAEHRLRVALAEWWQQVSHWHFMRAIPKAICRQVHAAAARLRRRREQERSAARRDARKALEIAVGTYQVRVYRYRDKWAWKLAGLRDYGRRGFGSREEAIDDARRVLGWEVTG